VRDSEPPDGFRASSSDPERESRRSARLVAVFLIGTAGLVTPLLPATSGPGTIAGLPTPFVFVFGFWLLLIGLIALAGADRGGGRR
jgi:hypothetical protein